MNRTKSAARLYYLDNLKVFLMALVMCHHLAISFGSLGAWYYRLDDIPGLPSMVVFTTFGAVNQAFFMSLFFLVSAYFVPPSLKRKGNKAFLKDRFLRLGIPLAVYYFVLNPTLVYIVQRFQGITDDAYLTFMSSKMFRNGGWGPLWFVLTLLIFNVIYVGVARWNRSPRELGKSTPIPGNKWILAFIILMGAVAFLIRLVYPAGATLIGLQLGFYPLYVAFFVIGILAYRRSWLEQLTEESATFWFRLSLFLIPIMIFLFFVSGFEQGKFDLFRGGLSWRACVYAAWEPFICVGVSMKLIVMFRKYLNRTGRIEKALAGSAYTAYIIHPFFVITATRLLRDVPLPPLLKFLAAAPVVVASCFFASNYIRKIPPLKRIL